MYTTETPRTPAPYPVIHDGMAVASFVLSVLWLGGLGSLLAIVLGHASRGQAHRARRQTSGLATAGAVIGWLGLIIALVIVVSLFIAASNAPYCGNYPC